MASRFERVLNKSGIPACLVNSEKKVLYQNEACKELCGKIAKRKCPQGCISACEKTLGLRIPRDGVHFFPNIKVGNQLFDVVFFGEGQYRINLLHPLRQKYDSWLKRFKGRGISRREMEIVRLCLQGFTNSKITQKLFISRATLKTHLNNIYKKIPEIRSENWRRLRK